jgi:hypothetical protein
MGIGNVVQRGSCIYIYDDKGRQAASIVGGGGRPGDGLKGYTSTTVNVQRGSVIYTYDEKGRQINSVIAG